MLIQIELLESDFEQIDYVSSLVLREAIKNGTVVPNDEKKSKNNE